MLRTVKLLALVAMFFVALTSSAQVTTSALSGVVTDENQQAMIGATITALHSPSGSEHNALSNMDGRYPIQGMRPGDPYTVTVNCVGYEPHIMFQNTETSTLYYFNGLTNKDSECRTPELQLQVHAGDEEEGMGNNLIVVLICILLAFGKIKSIKINF